MGDCYVRNRLSPVYTLDPIVWINVFDSNENSKYVWVLLNGIPDVRYTVVYGVRNFRTKYVTTELTIRGKHWDREICGTVRFDLTIEL